MTQASETPQAASGPNEIIHQTLRLRIMSSLRALPVDDKIEFSRLRDIVGATDGNLGAHITVLENAGYIDVEKSFVGRKPRTQIAITPAGRKALAQHVAYLNDLLG